MGGDAVTPDGGAVAESVTDLLVALTREVPDFPEPGVLFRDLTPVLADASDDTSRPVVYVGETQVMTNLGALPIVLVLGCDPF